MANPAKRPRRTKHDRLPIVHRRAAGLDVGSTFHMVAVPASLDPEPVRSFPSFTGELHALARWLTDLGITTVAMESTGVYWIPVFEVLQSHGLEVLLVNARSVKNVPGRKTDVKDAQWIQTLHEYGLLRGSFHPSAEMSALRAYLRVRERLVESAAAHIQHMQKALLQMNLQLQHVVSDIVGATGMRILRAIVAGERDPAVLAAFRDVRCTSSIATIGAALCGNYRAEHVFALRQALALYDVYQQKVADCDEEIVGVLRGLNDGRGTPVTPLPADRGRGRKQKNEPSFDIRVALYTLVGVDLTQIHGVGPYLALRLTAECGTDMSRWKTAKHFTSWLTLAPGNKISGGKLLSSRTPRSQNRAAALLRLAAVGVGKTHTALGAFYRRLSARIGKAKAVTATARKIAVLFYNTLRYGRAYADPGADCYERQYKQRVLRNLRRRAASLGLALVEIAAVPEGVS